MRHDPLEAWAENLDHRDPWSEAAFDTFDGEAPAWVRRYPRAVQQIIAMGAALWPAAMRAAVSNGQRSSSNLANLAFFMHHPARNGRPINPDEPGASALIELWQFFHRAAQTLLAGAPSAKNNSGTGRVPTPVTTGIVDRTAHSPQSKRVRTRDLSTVYALVLHQTAFSRGNRRDRYDRVTAHFVVLPDGTTIQLHPESAYLNSSNGLNRGSVAVEFVGNFPNTSGRWWRGDKFGRHTPSAAQIAAGRRLVRHLITRIGLTHILAHRQSSRTRANDPGPDIWKGVGQWAVDSQGLSDGGPTFRVGTGQTIPDNWRTWSR